ncbi:MAG: GIY-YIG nuclease family protein [Patescibacteria group bacterium]
MIVWSNIKSKIPHKSGVYQFRDKNGRIIYVGKAIDLYHRVGSYFRNSRGSDTNQPPRLILRGEISSVDTIVVESELEALILEANLIKKYLPKFNVSLRDDKDYLYIGITKEEFPKVLTIRRQDLQRVKKYFGPFPSSRTVRDTLKRLRRVFPWCSGTGNRKQGTGYSRACFYYHLGLCPGPCIGVISKEEYNQIIKRFSKFLEGKKEELVKELMEEMMEASDKQNYEEAGKIKKILDGINYLTQTNRVSLYLENPNFLREEAKLAVEALQRDLNLPRLPNRIEAYDISNIAGKDATGSLVVLTNGEIDKSQYRRFRIYISGRPNDVGMHKEMMRRRLKHPEWPMPDLIIVDGGRGQVRAVELEMSKARAGALRNLKLEIPIYGLAKRMEWLYPPEGDVIKLPRKSLSLKLLQKLRDESHRFAVSYHRRLRDRIRG